MNKNSTITNNEITFIPYTIEDIRNNPNVKRFFNLEKGCRKDRIYYFVGDNYTRRRPAEVIKAICNQFVEENDNEIVARITIGELCDMFRRGSLKINTETNNRKVYNQRGDVTSIPKKSKMVLGVINKDNTMPCLDMQLTISEQNTLCLIPQDGNQRSNALIKFAINEFEMKGTKTSIDGLMFENLPEEVQNAYEDRRILVKVLDTCCARQYSSRFEILNTTQTAMSNGEKIITQNADSDFVRDISKLVATNKNVHDIFSKYCYEEDIVDDVRMDAMSKALFSVGAAYLMSVDPNEISIAGKKGGRKKEAASTARFSSLNKVVNGICEIERTAKMYVNGESSSFVGGLNNFIEKVPAVCANIVRYFGPDFCHAMKSEPSQDGSVIKVFCKDSCTDALRYGDNYVRYARTARVSHSTQSVVFYVMHRLTDAYDNSIVVSNDVMREIVRNIDSYIGSSEYHEKFIEHKGANYTGRRIEAVMNNCVIPVCNRVGVSI